MTEKRRPRFSLRWNNVACKEPCGLCGVEHRPDCGLAAFIDDGSDTVCDQCLRKEDHGLLLAREAANVAERAYAANCPVTSYSLCPKCGRFGEYLPLHKSDHFICERCNGNWVGGDVLGGWEDATPEQLEQNRQRLAKYPKSLDFINADGSPVYATPPTPTAPATVAAEASESVPWEDGSPPASANAATRNADAAKSATPAKAVEQSPLHLASLRSTRYARVPERFVASHVVTAWGRSEPGKGRPVRIYASLVMHEGKQPSWLSANSLHEDYANSQCDLCVKLHPSIPSTDAARRLRELATWFDKGYIVTRQDPGWDESDDTVPF